MPWPLSQDYNEAIQNPASSFGDPELRAGKPAVNTLGLPWPRSGNFADVYEVDCPATGGHWAVKCFTREVAGLRERYREISQHLRQAKLPFMVDFDYQEEGIRVHGRWYPVLKMKWVEGALLNEFVRNTLDRPAFLEALTQIWARMGRYLRTARLAHGDLQHGNVLLVQGRTASALAVKLIDYDGMFVPALADVRSAEVGHPAYQHPLRQQQSVYGPGVDRFPLLAVTAALRCLTVVGRELWDRYDNGDNLLFRAADLRAPGKSALFQELWQLRDESAHTLLGHLALAAQQPFNDTPLIYELLGDDRLPPLTAGQEEQVTALLGIRRLPVPPPLPPPLDVDVELVPLAPPDLLDSSPLPPQPPTRRPTKRYVLAGLVGLCIVGLGMALILVARPWSSTKHSDSAPVAQRPPLETTPATSDRLKPVQAQPQESTAAQAEPPADDKPRDQGTTKLEPKPALPPEEDTKPPPTAAPAAPAASQANREKLPLPDAEQRKAAIAELKKAYQSQYAADYKTRKADDMRQLARELGERGKGATDSPAARHASLSEAIDWAARAGDVTLAFEMIDQLDAEFVIEPTRMKRQAVESACHCLDLPGVDPAAIAVRRPVIGRTLELLPGALAADDFEAADRLLAALNTPANLTQVPWLPGLLQKKLKDLQELRKEHGAVQAASQLLAAKPDDPDANAKVGRFLCLFKGDWEKGIPCLLKGNDGTLRPQAEKDQAGPAKPADQLAVGDGWWNLSNRATGLAQHQLRMRASHWYAQALPGLDGTRRDSAETRIRAAGLAPAAMQAHWQHLDTTSAVAVEEFLEVLPGQQLATRESFAGPVEIIAEVRTEKGSVRINAFRGGRLAFNDDETMVFRAYRPDAQADGEPGTQVRALNTLLKPNTWYTIRWVLTERGMEVYLQRQLLYKDPTPYDLRAERPVRLEAADSVIDVRSLSVKVLKR